MKNGRDDHHDDPKVTSLADARKKAEAAKKAKARAARLAGMGDGETGGPTTWRDRFIAAVLVVMALGFIASLLSPVWQSVVK